MSRASFNSLQFSLCVLCFFLIGLGFGICYWQIFLRIQCTSSLNRTTARIKSSFYDHFQYRTKKTCENANRKLFLTIAILSSYERLLIYLPAILNTWILTATNEIEVILFIEEKSSIAEEFIEKLFRRVNQQINSCLFIVKLKHVENAYPPQKKSFYAMKFIYTFYQQRTAWLLRLDDNAYVNLEELVGWLKSIDHRQALYIGQSGSGRHTGPAIHFPFGKYFCMGGSGVIVSQRTLVELGPWLDQCLKREIRTKHEDVELGRCILTHVRISCSCASNAKHYFYHHYGSRYLFGYDFTSAILSRAFIVHPIKDQTTFYQIFAFYTRRKQRSKYNRSSTTLTNQKSFVTFLTNMEFDLIRDVHYQLIDARWRSYIEDAVRSYVERIRLIWHQRSSNWTLSNAKFLFGYHRVLSSYGLELIVEVLLNAHKISRSSSRLTTTAAIRKRFHIRQPFVSKNHFDYREIINIEMNESIHQLNLIVVSSNKDKILMRFIENFEREVLKYPLQHQHYTLTILYFSQSHQANTRMLNLTNHLSMEYGSIIRLSIVNQNHTSYNRGLGRQLASQLFSKTQLLFFLDVDLVFTRQALDNTRRLMAHQLSISSCTVYFPIIFSMFSNMFLTDDRSLGDVTSRNGIFSIYGFGNVVTRKQDLDQIGGWETNNHEWGNEDVNLFQRFTEPSANCNVFRAVEPGLRHHYHRKMCNGIANIVRRKMCHDADGLLFGSQRNMANYLLKNKILDN